MIVKRNEQGFGKCTRCVGFDCMRAGALEKSTTRFPDIRRHRCLASPTTFALLMEVGCDFVRRKAIKQADSDDQVLPYPKNRRFLEAAMRSTHHKPMIHGLIEVDVTNARALLRDDQRLKGEPPSFTAFIIGCVAKAVDENRAVHALRSGSSRVILFADVDVLTWIERDVGGQQIILPYIFRSANHKTLDQLHGEMRAAQLQDLAKAVDGGAKALQRLPAWLYPVYFWLSTSLGRRYPRQWKKNWGTVIVSAVGMFGKGAGWGVPPSTPSLCWITLGGIGQKRVDESGQVRVRDYLSLTVSFDHNMIDGAPAARFTQRLKQLIEGAHGLRQVDDSAADRVISRRPANSLLSTC